MGRWFHGEHMGVLPPKRFPKCVTKQEASIVGEAKDVISLQTA